MAVPVMYGYPTPELEEKVRLGEVVHWGCMPLPYKWGCPECQNLIKTDEDGKIISAKYGNIPLEFDFDPFGVLGFTYYFNPDGTRNLEFDPQNNLFNWTRKQRKHIVKYP